MDYLTSSAPEPHIWSGRVAMKCCTKGLLSNPRTSLHTIHRAAASPQRANASDLEIRFTSVVVCLCRWPPGGFPSGLFTQRGSKGSLHG